ncbi:K+/H+ antiporter subunit F [Quisquiliibacterium transsilvanicum]|jgi:multicomponent K+:H+ antiporter subunit F|uniref:Multicomponent K+:H+ antiporter subunit F n=1 Tax=Quisquiliibacterium transsilvanicum TaxID=1549638 RepID=A0A7W8HG88_9BURK|nr:K+/H+ antiporter subunit F [Quisquiliibacterium transsilvanicum]MBB5271430.1 multicomponent K+:H+ antiporter subunit F [Quisquiliibacterium transsilvanicum]
MTILLLAAMGFAMACLGLAMLFASIRMFRGPTAQDRVMAMDTLYVSAMMMMLVLGMRYGSQIYFEMSLLIALVGFVGSVAMAKFLLRGEVIE